MRIVEVRKFLNEYVVYVNLRRDIQILKKDKRFHERSIYKISSKVLGYEFSFNCPHHTLKDAKRFVKEILDEKRTISQKVTS